MKPICPKCLDAAAVVSLSLTDGETLTCAGCDESYSADELAALLASWTGVMPRLRGFRDAPAVEERADT